MVYSVRRSALEENVIGLSIWKGNPLPLVFSTSMTSAPIVVQTFCLIPVSNIKLDPSWRNKTNTHLGDILRPFLIEPWLTNKIQSQQDSFDQNIFCAAGLAFLKLFWIKLYSTNDILLFSKTKTWHFVQTKSLLRIVISWNLRHQISEFSWTIVSKTFIRINTSRTDYSPRRFDLENLSTKTWFDCSIDLSNLWATLLLKVFFKFFRNIKTQSKQYLCCESRYAGIFIIKSPSPPGLPPVKLSYK